MLHVTNGDVVAELVRDARLPGAIVPWRDVLHEGPVPGLPFSHEELREVRARFIETCGWSPYEAVYGLFAARDRVLVAVQGTEDVVLWFERDLYDQLQLIEILDRLGARRASLIDLGEPRRIGVLDAVAGYESRTRVTGAACRLGRDAWRAFTSADPTDLERLLDAGTADLPFLEAALLRHLEESLPPVMGSHAPSDSCSTLSRSASARSRSCSSGRLPPTSGRTSAMPRSSST